MWSRLHDETKSHVTSTGTHSTPRCSGKGLKAGTPHVSQSKKQGETAGEYSGLSGLFAIAPALNLKHRADATHTSRP